MASDYRFAMRVFAFIRAQNSDYLITTLDGEIKFV